MDLCIIRFSCYFQSPWWLTKNSSLLSWQLFCLANLCKTNCVCFLHIHLSHFSVVETTPYPMNYIYQQIFASLAFAFTDCIHLESQILDFSVGTFPCSNPWYRRLCQDESASGQVASKWWNNWSTDAAVGSQSVMSSLKVHYLWVWPPAPKCLKKYQRDGISGGVWKKN